jgi:hypothetical protein
MSWLIKRLPKKRWKRVCIYILSGVVILVAADMVLARYWRQVTISYETTRITSPLGADGLPDYAAARNAQFSQGVTAENNAAPELLAISSDEHLDYWDWLKAHPPKDADLDQEWEEAIHKPWKSSEHPGRVAWRDSQRAALTKLATAVRKERFYVPWNSANPGEITTVLVPWLGHGRACANLLAADAMRAAGDGDAAAFQRDVLNIAKLARLVGQGSTLIEYLVAVAIDSNASVSLQAGACSSFLSAGDARELLIAWKSLPPFPTEKMVLDKGERFFSLNAFCEGSQHRLRSGMSDVPPVPMGSLFFPIHYNGVLRTFNHYFDELVAAQELPTYKQRAAAMKAVETEAASYQNFFDIGEDMVKILAPSMGKTEILQERDSINHDLATVALALRIYREEHGTFPESLGQLVPGVLDAMPTDGFAENASFHYRREGKGYVLYSVGDDGKDDGGRDRKSAGKGEGWDSVVRAAE